MMNPNLVLPAAPVLAAADSTLLQFRVAPAPTIAPPVPSLAAWAREQAPRPNPKKFILPGRSEPAAPITNLDAPPKLEVPNREQAIAGINISSVATLSKPNLPVPPSATSPVQVTHLPGSQPARAAGTVDAAEGDPAHILALSTTAVMPLDRIVSVAPGNTIPAPLPGGGAAGGSGSPRGNGAQAQGEAEGSSGAGRNPRAPAGAPDAGLKAPAHKDVAGAAPPAVIRPVHPPNGRFDIVVLQSSPSDAIPEGAGILLGKPVYTVYLHVGTERDWILQYCAIGSAAGQANGQVINLGDTSAIQAPYPISTAIPVLPPRTRYVLVHAILGANGRFRDLQLANEVPGIAKQDLLRQLQEWIFRPAIKADRPIDVEALLAIPPAQL